MSEYSDQVILEIFKKMAINIKSLDMSEKIRPGHFDLDTINKDWRDASDDGLFENIAVCIFVGGMKIKVVEQYWEEMRKAFGNFKIDYVADLKVESLINNPKIIKHRGKITALIHNANKIKDIQKTEGGFKAYLESRNKKGYDFLLNCIMKDFKYLKSATGADFLKDINLGRYKPDVHVVRILSRIGLYKQEIDDLSKVFERLSSVCQLTMPQIDRLLIRYGSGHKLRTAVCGTTPKCETCGIKTCDYANKY
jgi:3-methyladenine DNA glycosylase Tag